MCFQRAKKVVSDSPGLVDFATGLVNSVLNLPDRQVKFGGNSNSRRTVINPAHQIFLRGVGGGGCASLSDIFG